MLLAEEISDQSYTNQVDFMHDQSSLQAAVIAVSGGHPATAPAPRLDVSDQTARSTMEI